MERLFEGGIVAALRKFLAHVAVAVRRDERAASAGFLAATTAGQAISAPPMTRLRMTFSSMRTIWMRPAGGVGDFTSSIDSSGCGKGSSAVMEATISLLYSGSLTMRRGTCLALNFW